MHLTRNHLEDLTLLVDSHVADIAKRLPQYADAFTQRASREVLRPFADFLAKLESIRTSGRYTADGERSERLLAARTTRDALATVRASTVDTLAGQLEERRRAALTRPASTEEPVLRFLRLQELRNHLRSLDPVELDERIKAAVSKGANAELLDALEGAAPGFELAPAALIVETRAAIASRDHPELGELAQLKGAYEYLLTVAERALVTAAGTGAAALSGEAPAVLHDRRLPHEVTSEAVRG